MTALLLALVAQAPPATPAAARPGGESRVVYVQPLGEELPDDDVALVRLALERFYAFDVRLLPRVDLPRSAWYPARRRYRAERLLDFLTPRLPADGDRIMGLTGADISTTKGPYRDWGILGLATIDGTVSVISSYRCRKRKVGAARARVRLAKVAVHELGHTLGLEHCPRRGCLMEDAKGKVATTDGEHDLCRRCRDGLRALGRPIPERVEPPW